MPRIVIIHPEGNLTNNPNLLGLVEILCENGFEVDICSRVRAGIIQEAPTPSSRFFATDIDDPHDTAVLFPPNGELSADTLRNISNCFEGCALVIGIDRGIVEARILASIYGVPFGLISYELLFREETGPEYFSKDIEAAREASFAVCQDEVRSFHLSREYGVTQEKIIQIPVAGRKAVRRERNFILHDQLDIPRSTKLVLYIGGVTSAWSGIDRLIDHADRWPDDWALVLHQRYAQYGDAFINYIRSKGNGRIFLSPFPNLPFEQLGALLDSADLGISLYVPTFREEGFRDGNNLKYIGMASGKIATYLQHGLPILVNEIGEMSDHVRRYGLGCVTGDIADVASLLAQVDRPELESFRDNALNFFRDRLDLDRTAKPLLEIISRLVQVKSSPPSAGPVPTCCSRRHAPSITIVTPSFNQAPFLEQCIESVLGQNYPNLEFIIMDGGSTDGSVEIIRKYEKYLAYWQSRPDGGQYDAINSGFGRSTGEIMTWLNSDDVFHPGAFDIVAAVFADRAQVEWLSGRPNGIGPDGTQAWVLDDLPLWSRERYLQKNYRKPYIQQEGTFWRRNLWVRAGGHISRYLDFARDLELWARFFRHAQLYSIDALLAGYRQHPDQKMAAHLARYDAEAEAVLEREAVLFEREGSGIILPAPLPIIISKEGKP